MTKIIFSVLIITTVILNAGCSTVEKVEGSRRNEYYVRCSVFSGDKKDCHERAQKICPKGYRVIEDYAPPETEYGAKPERKAIRKVAIVGITVACK